MLGLVYKEQCPAHTVDLRKLPSCECMIIHVFLHGIAGQYHPINIIVSFQVAVHIRIPHPVLKCSHGLQGACMYMNITDVHCIGTWFMYYKGPHPQIQRLYNQKPLPTMLYLCHTPYKHHFIRMLYAHVNRDTQCIEVKATAKSLGSKNLPWPSFIWKTEVLLAAWQLVAFCKLYAIRMHL